MRPRTVPDPSLIFSAGKDSAMSLAIAFARAQLGLQAPLVTLETHLSPGLPSFNMVGLAETAVREARERVRSAILNAGFEFPQRRITINLAPADLPKDGTRFDLALALSILAASGQLPPGALENSECLAELALSGLLRPVTAILPAALAAQQVDRALVCAPGNAGEVSLCAGLRAYFPASLREVCAHLDGTACLPVASVLDAPPPRSRTPLADLTEVRGQLAARRALEVAAAGRHNLLMVGPPGTGKTMLATRLPGLLPALPATAALEAAVIRSVAGALSTDEDWRIPPFRAPHHSASAVALIGGGGQPRPGEVSLAHRGVLFLDELPEFRREALEALRQPLESRCVIVSRAARQATFPADFLLVAAMNPCPCGYAGDPSGRCQCAPARIARYLARLSGPLLDRIDLQVEVMREEDWLRAGAVGPPESSAAVAARVTAARHRQLERQGCLNAELPVSALSREAALGEGEAALLEEAFTRFRISPRTCHRVLRVARTLADLQHKVAIDRDAIAEALALRRLDLRQAQTAALYGG